MVPQAQDDRVGRRWAAPGWRYTVLGYDGLLDVAICWSSQVVSFLG